LSVLLRCEWAWSAEALRMPAGAARVRVARAIGDKATFTVALGA
jgi:hypothetical protein